VAKILVVEPDPQVRELLLLQLRHLGHDPVDGGAAGDVPGAGAECDAVVLEPVSPVTRLFAALLRLRFPELPILFVSIESPTEATMKLGPARYLVKPVSLATLQSALEDVLRATPPS
jgi:DNA-binding response OmpR family regulator